MEAESYAWHNVCDSVLAARQHRFDRSAITPMAIGLFEEMEIEIAGQATRHSNLFATGKPIMNVNREIIHSFLLTAALAVGAILPGCNNKETLLDVDTPDGGVEIQRDKGDGSITVDVEQ